MPTRHEKYRPRAGEEMERAMWTWRIIRDTEDSGGEEKPGYTRWRKLPHH